MSADYTKLLKKLFPDEGGEPTLHLRTMVVAAVNSDGTVNLTTGGVTVPDVAMLSSVPVVVGSRVQVLTARGVMLVLGPVAQGLTARVTAGTGTNVTGWTNTTAAAGSPAVQIVFTAPPSGRVNIGLHAALQAASGQAFASVIVRAGGTPGSGTIAYNGSVEPEPRLGILTGTINASCVCPVEGLTPGSTYNAQAVHWVAAGATGSLFSRQMFIDPAP
jgi:hypothetical protein